MVPHVYVRGSAESKLCSAPVSDSAWPRVCTRLRQRVPFGCGVQSSADAGMQHDHRRERPRAGLLEQLGWSVADRGAKIARAEALWHRTGGRHPDHCHRR
jgi:hypothetical protein